MKERFLGLSINILIIQGLYLLEYNFLVMLLCVFTVMWVGLEYLVQDSYSDKTSIKAWTKEQEIYFMMIPMYPVIHRLYYNYVVPKNIKIVPHERIKYFKEAFDFSFDIISIVLTIFIFSFLSKELTVIYAVMSIFYIWFEYFHNQTYVKSVYTCKIHQIEKNHIIIDKNKFFIFEVFKNGLIIFLDSFISIIISLGAVSISKN